MNVRIFIKSKNISVLLTKIYLFCMFSFFLFYYQDYYFDMTDAKYTFFLCVSSIFVSLGMLVCILRLLVTKHPFLSLRSILADFSIGDWGFLLLLCSHILTTLFSSYPIASLTGSSGRHLGLYFTFIITLLYFLISRNYHKDSSFMVFQVSLCIAVSLGVLNFFGIDPLGFNARIAEYDIPRFLSTIGNISFFADALCLSLPFSITLYCLGDNSRQQLFSLIASLFGILGLYICNADGGFIGIGAFLLIFMIYVTKSYEAGKRFLGLMLLFLGVGQGMHLLTLLFPNAGRGFTTLSYVFTSSVLSYLLFLHVLGLYAFYVHYPACREEAFRKQIRRVLLLVFGIGILAFLVCFFYFSIVDTTSNLGVLDSYLRYGDAWGTGRGITWNRLIPVYLHDFTWLQKAFGYGLDCTRNLLVDHYSDANIALYDNAHNEYLQYIVTSGFFGLLSYSFAFFSIQVRLWKYRAYNLFGFALSFCLLAHGFQAIVGLTQPFSTPLLFIIIAIAEASLRQTRDKKQDNDKI